MRRMSSAALPDSTDTVTDALDCLLNRSIWRMPGRFLNEQNEASGTNAPSLFTTCSSFSDSGEERNALSAWTMTW